MVKSKNLAVSSLERLFRFLVAAFFLFGLLPVPVFAQGNGTMAGSVTDNSTGNPIPGASLYIFTPGAQQPSWTGNSDNVGAYAITVPEGTGYEVAARKTGYVAQRKTNKNVTDNQTTTVNFSLLPGGVIQGQVTDNSTGAPVPGVSVFAFKPQTPQVTFNSLLTNAQGDYSLTAPPDTGYTVRAQKEGYLTAEQAGVNAVLGSPQTRNLTLLTPPPVSDNVSPAAITNLAVVNPTPNSLTLTWTAPGDDGTTGQASAYDIRYASTAIDDDSKWGAATQVSGEPAPHAAGQSENFTVGGLTPQTAYFFAIKTADEVPNWSARSNSPGGTTAAAPPPPGGEAPVVVGAPPGMMAGPGMLLPALGVNLSGTGKTLVSVKVSVLIPAGSPFNPTAGLAPLSATNNHSGVALYKDNKSADGFGHLDPPDSFQDQYLPLASTPAWTQNGGAYETTLTLASPAAVPADDTGNNAGQDFFVVINTSNNPPPGATFQLQVPANGITLNTGTLPAAASPESPNTITIGQGGMMGSPVVISEIQTAGGGSQAASDEFMELYNRAPNPIDLSTWSVQYKEGTTDNLSASSPAIKLNLTGSIPAKGYLLMANSTGYDFGGTKAPNVTYTDAAFALAQGGGTVFLANSQEVLTSPAAQAIQDRVAWGSGNLFPEGTPAPAPPANGSLERKAFPQSTSTSMTTGIDASLGNSFDSSNNLNDFILRTVSGPQNNTDTESPEVSGSNPVVINEVYYHNTAASHQWIELYNNSGAPLAVSGWRLKAAGNTYTVPASTSIGANGYLAVHWNTAGTDNATNLYTGTAGMAALSTLAGDVYLTDGSNGAKDYVAYGAGGQASEGAAGGSQWAPGDFVPGVLQGQSIGRGNNGYDTNKASDWQTFGTPTPGAANAGGDSFAPDPVANVALADNDALNFGLNGQDVTVTWTPAASADATFGKYVIFLLPFAAELDTVSHTPFAEVFGAQGVSSFTASPARIKDSAGADLAGGSYRAYVMAVDMAMNKSAPVGSPAATLVAETSAQSGTDTSPPMIMSMPVWMAKEGSSTVVLAYVRDDRQLDATTPVQLKWRVHGQGSFTAVTGAEAASGTGLYRQVLPWNPGWNTSTQIDFYLMAKDGAGNYTYFTANPAFDTAPTSHDASDEGTAAANSFLLRFAPASGYNRTLSGSVFNSVGAPLSGAVVMVPGAGLDIVTTGGDGAYSFTVADGNYSLAAVKAGYREGWIDGVSVNAGNTAATGKNFYLSEGSSGAGGDAEKAFVRWTDPSDGMMGAPLNISQSAAPIVAHMSEPMDSSTIIDTNAADAGSNVYLTTTGQDRVAGQVAYDQSNPNDPRIVFYSGTPLNKGTTYFFVIMTLVTDLAGNPIEGNQPDGRYVMQFTTISDVTGGTYGSGVAFPPFVTGSMPAPGSFRVPTNTKISVSFSEAMDPATIEASNSTGTNVRLYDPNYQGSGTGEYVTLASVELDDATGTMATLTVGGAGLVASHHYEVRVLGGAKSMKGIYMANPSQAGYASTIAYQSGFDTGSGVDTSGAPQVRGTNLEMYRQSPGGDISVADTLVNVPVNVGVIEVGFNKDIDPLTVNHTTITLKVGTTQVQGSVSYRPLDRVATFAPSLALNPNTTYTLKVQGGSSGIADTIGGEGHYLAADFYAVFTTSGQTDTQPPRISFANTSDFKMAVTFAEPMNAAKATSTDSWPGSVLNPANYTLYTDMGPPEVDPTGAPYTGNGATGGNLGTAQGLVLTYYGDTSTVNIEGLQLSPTGGFRLWVNNVTDLSGNTIEGNVAAPELSAFGRNATGGPVGSSTQGGMMGPGTKGMTGPGGGGIDMGNMGMMRVGVSPTSMIAGATTTYMVDIPLNRAIPPGGTIVLTFPSGFDISGARNADPSGAWAHKDINGPGPGTVVLSNAAESPQSGGLDNDGVLVNTSARAVTIKLGAVGTAGYQTDNTTDDRDFVHLELAAIKNSNIPKSFETSGYTVDIKTMAGGSLMESLTSMPFFITESGQYSISGNLTFPNSITTAPGQPVRIFGGSPMVGPIDVEVTFANSATASYSITGLPAGEYMIMAEQVVAVTGGVGNGEYFGSGMPEPIRVDSTTTTGNVYTKNFTFTSTSGKPGLVVNIVGDFTGSKASDVDVFAGSPQGFSVKTVNLASNYAAESPFSTTLYLPGPGTFKAGMGPAMPKGQAPMGPPPMPAWTPPPPVDVRYDGTAWTEASATPNDGIVRFTVGTSLAVNGSVRDGADNPIPNVEVYAYSSMGMSGTRSTSRPDGSFTLNLPEGTYKTGAFLPGMPTSVERNVDVRLVGGQTKIYVDGVERDSLLIKIAKPERTISGKVTDGTNTVAGASVYAYRTNGPGHVEAMTDSSGVYILYVVPGTWNIGAFLPGYGPLPEKTGIGVTTSDVANVNFFPETGVSYVNISGNVVIGGVAQSFIPIRAVELASNGTFTGYENGASTDSNGNYSIKVKAVASGERHYRVDIWTPQYGELAANSGSGVTHTPTPDQPWNVAVTTASVANVNIEFGTTDLKNLTISFTGGAATMTAYIDLMKIDPATGQPLGTGRHFEVKDLSQSTTVSLPAGAYHGFAHIPGYGEFTPTEADSPPHYLNLTSDSTATFDLSGVGQATVSGTVRDGQGNPVPNAFVHIGNPQTGAQFGSPGDASGQFTLAVKPGTYLMGADKPGYSGEPATITVSSGANTKDLTLTKTSLTISGHVYADANSNGSYDAGEGLPFASVHAEKLGGGFTGTPADPDGSFTLYVSPGDWRLVGAADGYQKRAYDANPVNVEGSAITGVNIRLTNTISLSPPKARPFKPASGSTFEDQSAGLKITVPPMAVGSDTSDFQVQGKETSNLPTTPTAAPLGGKGKKVSIFDANGNSVTTLSNDIGIEMTYTKAELVAAGFSSLEAVAKIKMAYWDEAASTYVPLPTTISYSPATGTTWDNLVSVTFKGTTSHLTVFSPISPTDSLSPAPPTSLAVTAGNGQVALSWTAPTTNADGSSLADLHGYEVYRSTSATGPFTQVNATDVTSASYTDTSVTNGTTYYYQVTSADTGGNESAKSSTSGAATPSASGGAAPAAGGGGGGGNTPGLTSVLNSVTGEGKFVESVTARSEDEKIALAIPKGTVSKSGMGLYLSTISITRMASPPAPPENSKVIGLVYDFGPSGTTFDPPVELAIKYDASLLPAGATEKSLVIATFDTKTGKWVEMESTADRQSGTVKARVSHFSAFTVLARTRPASFALYDLTVTPAEVTVGQSVTIAVRLTNQGDLKGDYQVPLKIGDVVVTTKEVTLEGGASEKVTFTTTKDAPGAYAVQVAGLTGTFRVKAAAAPAAAPASFSLGSLSISPAEVDAGREVTVSVTVTNTGGQSGSYELGLKVNQETAESRRITLAAGASERVTFTLTRAAAGRYTVAINDKTGTLVVREAVTEVKSLSWWEQSLAQINRWREAAGNWWDNLVKNIRSWVDSISGK